MVDHVMRKRDLSFVLTESEDGMSRDERTLAANASAIEAGTVIAEDADGKIVPCVAGAADTTETPIGLLAYHAPAGDERPCVIIARHAQLRVGMVVFDASFDTQVEKDAAFATLANSMIVAR